MTKKYFGTDGIRGRVGDANISPQFFLQLGWAVGKVLADQNTNRRSAGLVLIGKDTRVSGYMFESALEAGLISAGVDVGLLGPMPTPAIAYLTRTPLITRIPTTASSFLIPMAQSCQMS